MKKKRVGLRKQHAETVRALMPIVLGCEEGEEHLVDQAVERFDAFLRSIPDHEQRAVDRIRQLITVVRWKCFFERGAFPEKLDLAGRRRFVRDFFESDGTLADSVLDLVGGLFGDRIPTVRDLAKSFREMLSLAFYTNPETDSITGYTPVWKRDDIWTRPDVGPAHRPAPRGWRIDVDAVLARHEAGRSEDAGKLFRNDGAPKVAILGSGAGGAVVAAHLAQAGYDVAVFDSGPRFSRDEYPLDALEGMSLLFEEGLLTLNHNLDVHLLRGRLVGGSTVLTSGMSIEMRKSTLASWTAGGMGLDAGAMRDAFRTVERRLRIDTLDPGLTTGHHELIRRGALKLNAQIDEVLFDFQIPPANTMTRRGQHGPTAATAIGRSCLGCGLCNYGCRFGHKLSMDVTYIPAAEAAGARVHPNTPIDHLAGEWDPERRRMKITHLVLGRGSGARVPVDHVVLAAGAVGSPAILLRSAEEDHAFERLPPFVHGHVGTGLGFNYGTTVVARWDDAPMPPGDTGIQIKYVATKAGDEDYVFETAFIPAGLMANVVPGVGADHRRWMRAYKNLGMCVNTIGSPQHGRVKADRTVVYRVDEKELDVIRKTIASMVKMYLASGASEVGLAGIRQRGHFGARFRPEHAPLSEVQIDARLKNAITEAEHVMLSSAHPQGGLRMNESAEQGAVGADFRVHGIDNVFVSDASLFPSTIVVNPQWTVMALATVAAAKIASVVAARR